MTANFVSFCACTNFTAPSELLSGKRDGLQLSPCLRRNQISSPRTSLFIRRTREKLWWNFSLVCCASSPNDGLGSEPSGASLSGKTGRTAGVVDDGVLQYPLVNREQAVYEVLRNFRKAVLVRAAGNDRARPTSSFLPQLYGIGKSVFGEDFHHFLYTSKDYLSQRIGHMPGVPPGPNVKERSVDALISGTLYAFVDIRGFYSTGIEFEPELIKRICKEAVSGFPNSSTLLDEVYKSFDKQELWIEKLLQVTNKRYLFLFIDEIGDLTSSKFKRFVDLYSEDEKETNLGRTESVLSRIGEALASRLELKFVALNPFSEDVVKSFIKGTTRCEDGEPVLKILFPNHPEGPDWFFQQMYIYSGGVPIYLVHILRELVELRETRKGTDLSEDDMEAMIGSIPMNTSVLIVPAYMSPETMNVFCSMLLASFLELRFDQKSFVNVNGHRRSLLDVANALGFYCAVVSTEGKQTSAKQADFIKLIYPKYALQYLKLSYWKHPPIRFLHSLFPSICPEDSPSTRGYKFEILFSLILYVRLSVCKQLGELGIFRQSLVEEIPKDADDEYISRIVPSFRSKIDGDHSAGEKSYSTSAWKKFFDKYLSKDGIFFPNRQNSSGPDVILRVSAPLDGVSSAPKEGQSSQKQISIEETSSDKKRIYSIGIALKYYNLSGPGVDFSMIRREVAKFLEPVSSQLELKGNNNITAIQLIVCNKYHENVLRHFTDHQNLVLNSGVYYEDDDGNLKSNLSDFSSYSKKKWLEVHVNCQVVICSPQNLKDFLGSSVYENLERGFNDDGEKFEDFDPLKDMLERSFQGLWTDIPYEEPPGYLGLTTEPDMLSTESMNVKRTERKGAKADSSVVSVRQGQFDWMEFLKTYCDLTESEARECCDTVKVMREQEFASVDTAILEGLGIEDPMTRLKIVAGIRRYIRKKPRS